MKPYWWTGEAVPPFPPRSYEARKAKAGRSLVLGAMQSQCGERWVGCTVLLMNSGVTEAELSVGRWPPEDLIRALDLGGVETVPDTSGKCVVPLRSTYTDDELSRLLRTLDDHFLGRGPGCVLRCASCGPIRTWPKGTSVTVRGDDGQPRPNGAVESEANALWATHVHAARCGADGLGDGYDLTDVDP